MNNANSENEDALYQQVSLWYRSQALEIPTEKLDADILQLSQTQLADSNVTELKLPPKKSWRKVSWGLSSAASLLIIFGLVLINPWQFEDALVMTPTQSMDEVVPVLASAARINGSPEQPKLAQSAQRADAVRVEQELSNTEPRMNSISPATSTAELAKGELTDAVRPLLAEERLPLSESLAQLQKLLNEHQSQQALALEQKLLKHYPALAAQGGQVTREFAEQRARFKLLQLQRQQQPQ
ncbi:hypothetical protein [Shewanella acanthi]|uniref:hypothetical protein n=1 Tax=Shewanella acanthi TaxID=2864212 RepID=UPI001C65F62B|nr:hypothetical protein [Shewanella acanthi]QYJ78091.1 hypothetical protein K0H61_13325 [Shewanella acanthi]